MALNGYRYFDSEMKEDLDDKFKTFNIMRVARGANKVTIAAFMDGESEEIWMNVLPKDKEKYYLLIVPGFGLIPLPDEYEPAQYSQYKLELNDYVQKKSAASGAISKIYNLGSQEEPKMNLLIATDRIKFEDLSFESQLPDSPKFLGHSERSIQLRNQFHEITNRLRMAIERTVVDRSDGASTSGSSNAPIDDSFEELVD